MKLVELMADTVDFVEPEDYGGAGGGGNIDAHHRPSENEPKKLRPHGANMGKALKIRNLARMKAKATDTAPESTPYQYNLGGHVSAFLNR